ncbi:uncharacterized protein LOC103718236 isoform X2 [Phoenix dactylifera]|uniref:protein-serine/threonine phosphatase n=1 Tax=Phoenix dactylifera TaxID=42345 RepID=A0A8B9AWS6_PHODC|nr:uncharacterized protein LOC103718236 isoform X2 [Phoenix dactylifera]
MAVQGIILLGLLLLLLRPIPSSSGESLTCLAVYREGGAPAVFQSPKCSRWTLLADDARRPPPNCQAAMHLGRRRSQEDRTVCALGMRIPFLGRTGIEDIDVGMVAVFDGHNGAEASDMASKLLLEYFLLHLYFLLDGIYSMVLRNSDEKLTYGEQNMVFQVFNLDRGQNWHKLDPKRSKWILPTIFDESLHMEILKESLLRAIHDIDASFSKETLQKNLESGSTATVVLIAGGQILAANVGDSKAFLCSESFHPHDRKGNRSKLNRQRRNRGALSPVTKYGISELANYDGPTYYVKELTMDHHPDREDERSRVEAAGGYVLEWAGVLRINGELAVSRAIGDVPFKNYGVISTPEVTDWQSLTSNDSYLIAASDGIFEKMTTQEVCDLLWYEKLRADMNSDSIRTIKHSLADYIVKIALEKGSMDNMAVVVVPLGSFSIFGSVVKDGCDSEETSDSSFFGLHRFLFKKSDDAISTSLLPREYFDRITLKFKRLLVETKFKRLGCFYLSENLNENMEYVFQAPKEYHEVEMPDLYNDLEEPVVSYHGGGPLERYKEQKLCWHFGMHDGDKGQCTSPEVFAKFLGLLDSIPYSDTGFNTSESFGYKIPDFRYILKRRFDRGSYGEVWLAFHWNCSQDGAASDQLHKNPSHVASCLHLDPNKCNMSTNTSSSDKHCFTDSSDDNLFILKRIMVERGAAAYLSGLREKYFGELFLNASKSPGGLTATDLSTAYLKNVQLDYSDLLSYEEGLKHIARFVESFESESKEIWLVFRNEGLSLSKLIYTAEETKLGTGGERDGVRNIQVLHPSAWWYWLRTTEAGKQEIQSLIWQLLMALKSCHDRNITHRDIKPENMIVCFEDVDTGRCLREIPSRAKQMHLRMYSSFTVLYLALRLFVEVRIIDFGSAIDDFTMKHLYGSGPTRSEQTFEYTPPEALLNASWFQGPKSVTLKYDMWSVGVVILELILGSPHVFQISDRTRALLDQHLEGWSEHTKELAYRLRSYMEMCILIPGISPQQHQNAGTKYPAGVSPASWKCSEESFSHQVKSKDPLKLGFPNVWALRLVRQLLVWHPEDRLSIDEALSHPYFQQQHQKNSHREG